MFSVMELKTIECVAFEFFYNEGAKGEDVIQKNKFRCQVDSDTTKRYKRWLHKYFVDSHPQRQNTISRKATSTTEVALYLV